MNILKPSPHMSDLPEYAGIPGKIWEWIIALAACGIWAIGCGLIYLGWRLLT